MRFENCNGVKALNGGNQTEQKKALTGRMPYVFVRENAVNWWTTVQGLNHYEVRLLSEKVSDQPEAHADREKKAEFSVPTWQILNALERLGYRVVTSSCMITGFGKHDTRDFIWTMHKAKEDWEASSK